MKYMMTYDLMESMRNTNQWLGATARAFASYPMMSFGANPAWIGSSLGRSDRADI